MAVAEATNVMNDRRGELRRPPHEDSHCRLLLSMGGVVRTATIFDVSTEGLGLVFSRPLETGTELNIELINPATRFSRKCMAKVMHADEAPDRRWVVGFRFHDPLSDDELAQLL